MDKVKTSDGSFTYYSSEFDENYHSLVGAWTESLHKFVYPSHVLDQDTATVLDIGFGLGYNTLALLRARKPGQKFRVYALELYRETVEAAVDVHTGAERLILEDLLAEGESRGEWGQISLFLGDARINLAQIAPDSVDAVFLDPFSPPKNPELWTVQFLRDVWLRLVQDGVLLTYSSALPVIAGLVKAGFQVSNTPPIGRRRGGIKARKNSLEPRLLLDEADQYLFRVSANAVPNIDHGLWPACRIAAYRQKLIQWLKEKGFLLSHKQAGKLYRG